MTDAYRPHIARWLWLVDKAGWNARPLDVDDMALVEKVRETGRLMSDCGTLGDLIKSSYSDTARSPTYRDEQGRLDAYAQYRATGRLPRAPQYHEVVTAQRPEVAELQAKEYRQRWAKWDRAVRAVLKRRDGVYAQAIAELRVELADIELANQRASIERLAFIEKQEAERAKRYHEQRVKRARAELQRALDRQESDAEMRRQWRAYRGQQRAEAEQRRAFAAQRAKDEAEFEATEHNQRLAAAAGERRELEDAKLNIKIATQVIRKTGRRISREQQSDREGHGGHP